MRALQLCLAWELGGAVDSALADKPAALDGLVLKLSGSRSGPAGPIETGSVDIPLTFNSPYHPVLEETLAELALGIRGDNVYRRYTVVIQPAPQMTPSDFAGFLDATAPGKDPYGWGALQAL